jgi:hypothetical protein
LLLLNTNDYFSHNPEEIFFDYEFLSKRKNKIRTMASKKQDVSNWLASFKEAGLYLKTITADALALEKFLNYHRLVDKNTVFGVFYLDNQDLLQVIIVDGFVFFLNAIRLETSSSSCLMEEIAKFLKLYELNKGIFPVSDIIVFCEDIKIDCKKLDNYSLSVFYQSPPLNVSPHANYPLTCLLPLGTVLPC